MAKTLYDKLWDSHVVHLEDDGTALLYIDRHLVHEVTSPQAYEGLRAAGRKPWRVDSIVATADHNTPTTNWDEGLAGVRDTMARLQIETLDQNIRAYGAKVYFPFLDKRQGMRSDYNHGCWLSKPGLLCYGLGSAPKRDDVGLIKWKAMTTGADATAPRLFKANIDGMAAWVARRR